MQLRKSEHIELTQQSQTDINSIDNRFYYEPITADVTNKTNGYAFLGKQMQAPIWISSITGGATHAKKINGNLARACAEFGLGMGLGSCRVLLDNDFYFDDFNWRKVIGDNLPFYANIGICQLEQLLKSNNLHKITNLIKRLHADGIIIHVNPLQEFLQKEGDKLTTSPIQLITQLLEKSNCNVIVKEVGQGFGPNSINALLQLPLQAIELAAFGGTNFALLEQQRNGSPQSEYLHPLINVGHTAEQMINEINKIVDRKTNISCNQIIVSGGIQNFLDGYYLTQKCKLPAIYGQAAVLLEHANNSYEQLQNYIASQIEGLKIAQSYLRIVDNQ